MEASQNRMSKGNIYDQLVKKHTRGSSQQPQRNGNRQRRGYTMRPSTAGGRFSGGSSSNSNKSSQQTSRREPGKI